MNQAQYKTLAAALIGMLGSYLVGRGTFTVEDWGAITKFLTENGPALLSAAGAVYLWFKNRPSEQVKTAGKVLGAEVKVDTSVAAPEVVAVAMDNVNLKVTPVKAP